MTDFNIATGEEQPLNRTGFDNVQVSGEYQGVPVGIDNSGTDPQLVKADAASDANSGGSGPVTAVGVMFNREVLPAGKYGGVNTHPWDDVEAQIYEEGRTKVGDRCTAVRSGIELVNDDEDTDFTPGEPVYLDVGGGFTQTKPTGSGEAVQVLGIATTEVVNDLDPANGAKDRLFLEVDADYETLA
jgi:hypothetical protein